MSNAQTLIARHEDEYVKLSAQILEMSERRKELQAVITTLRTVDQLDQQAAANAASPPAPQPT